MMINKVIISIDNGWGAELLNYREYGKVVNRDDLQSLATSTYDILKNDNLRNELENKSLEISKEFDSNLIVNKIYDVINS